VASFVITIKPRVQRYTKPMSLKYEPASEPLHSSVVSSEPLHIMVSSVDTTGHTRHRCRANSAQIGQPRPDSGLGYKVQVLGSGSGVSPGRVNTCPPELKPLCWTCPPERKPLCCCMHGVGRLSRGHGPLLGGRAFQMAAPGIPTPETLKPT